MTLMTGILLWPALVRTTSKVVFSSSAPAPSPPPAAPAPAIMTGAAAAAETPHRSSSDFLSSTSSRTDISSNCSGVTGISYSSL